MRENLKDKQQVYESISCPFGPGKMRTRKTNIYTYVQIRHVMIIPERVFNDNSDNIYSGGSKGQERRWSTASLKRFLVLPTPWSSAFFW